MLFFSYYNELGDDFSFINSEEKEQIIKIEDDTDITVFVNILLLGRTGAGKSTLINLLLGEKKSIEGGTGLSTTSRNIIVFKKTGVPIRLYDVKGIENEKTIDNYYNILTDFNINKSNSNDAINAIFYCIEYKKGTIIEKMEFKLFEKLITFDIQIIFIITKTPYDINEKTINKKTKKSRKNDRDTIENTIKNLIKSAFKNRTKEGEEYINNYVKFYYVNLIPNYSLNVPVFGIDKLLSFFSESVSEEDWDDLEQYCFQRDESKCKEYCKNNPFLKYYSEFEKINKINQNEADEYLSGLKAGAFFSGMLPGVDIGMEYFYKNKFKTKLKSLYGFNYDEAKEIVEKEKKKKEEAKIQEEKKIKEDKEYKLNEGNYSINSFSLEGDEYNEEMISLKEKQNFKFNDQDYNKRTNNTKKEEENIESEINKEINNKGKNTSSVIRVIFEVGGVIVKSLPTAGEITLESGAIVARAGISAGLKIASWVFLPLTCVAFGTWSFFKVKKDCKKILEIFTKAFTPLRFDTLFNYIRAFRFAIAYLKIIGEKIIKDSNEEVEEEEEEEEEK